MDRRDTAYRALNAVSDPELDEPITTLGFVRSLEVTPEGNVEAHLRLPTSFCSPNFAYLMASDAKDALTQLEWTRRVVVELDDHHDSPIINAGLAADAGYRGTFGHEAEDSLDELRDTFRRKAHTAAMERCLTALIRAGHAPQSLASVTLAELPDDDATAALLRRRAALELPTSGDSLVLVDHAGRPPADPDQALRRARSTRISIDGNAHFCRGLLATRYGEEPAAFLPLPTFTIPEGAHS
jgi:metal-sulfur cluster biosynthetic enzyme